MNPFAAFDTLALVVEVCTVSVAVTLAVVLATLLAWSLSPFSPSEMLGDVILTPRESDVYIATQWRLHETRARRRALTNGDTSTRRMSDATIPDLSLARSFPVVVAPTMVIA